jgi:hypothetical protein
MSWQLIVTADIASMGAYALAADCSLLPAALA